MDGWIDEWIDEMDEGEVTGEVGLVTPGKSDGGAKGISLVSDIEEKVMMMTMGDDDGWRGVGGDASSWGSTPHAHRQAFCGGRGMGLGGQG